jgi:hypothetical protein
MKRKFVALYTSAMCVSSLSLAMPSAYVSKFGALPITNTTEADLIRDTEDAQTVWVLPPKIGLTTFSGFWASGNLGFCPGLKNLYKASNNLDNQIIALSSRVGDLVPDIEQKKKELERAQQQLAEAAKAPGMDQLISLEDEVANLEERKLQIIALLETCEQACDVLAQEYRSVKESAQSARESLTDLRNERQELAQDYDRLKSIVDERQEEVDDATSAHALALEKLQDIKTSLRSLYAEDSRIEGGFATIDYNLGWKKAVAALEQEYPEFEFRQIPTANVRVNAAFVSAASEQSYRESVPAILDYSLAGLPFLPWGEKKADLSSMPDSLDGNLRLSLIGACPLATENFFDDSTGSVLSDEGGKPLFGLSIQYDYPAAYKTHVTASYNLYKVYERVAKSGTRGGFFSSKSYSDVAESSWAEDEFSIDWQIEDPNSSYDEKKREEIKTHIKAELIDRALNSLAQPIPGRPEFAAPAPAALTFIAKPPAGSCERATALGVIAPPRAVSNNLSMSRRKKLGRLKLPLCWLERRRLKNE